MRVATVTAIAIVVVMLGAGFGAVTFNASAAQSGADSYGYAYTDSKLPDPSVTFAWIDVTATGTYLPLSGDFTFGGPYAIGFDFYFYGERYSMINVSTNGFITFGPGSSSLSYHPIPYPYDLNNIIAPYWAPLVVDTDELVVDVIGVEPNRRFVLEWVDIERYFYPGFPMTFEIILDESSNDIWFQYSVLSGMTGDDATIGIENSAGTDGVQYGCYQPVLENGLAVKFSRLPVAIASSQTGYAAPGSAATYDLTVMNLQPFSDTLDITFVSVEGWAVSLLGGSMLPLVDTDFDSVPDVGELPAYSEANIVVIVEVPSTPIWPSETTNVTASSSVDPLVSNSCTLTTSVSPAWFDPPHADHGYDYDADGLYDMLIVEISVYSRVSGWYNVYGYLKTYLGYLIQADYENSVYMGADESRTLELAFYGHLIRETGIDGPYRVDLSLMDDYWTEVDAGTHETAAYVHTDFEEIPGEFLLPFADEVVDEDMDGFYDYLEVEAYLEVNQAGWFFVQGSLFDSTWTWIDDVWTEGRFEAGSHTVVLRFDPWAIWTDAYDGEFYAEVSLYGQFMDNRLHLGYFTHTTEAYEVALFERPPTVFGPPHGEHVVDDDVDTLWEALVVEASVDVAVEGDYAVQGTMLTMYSWFMEVVTVRSHLSEGLQTVELSFPGFSIGFSSWDGPYSVRLDIEGNGRLMDTDSYVTQAYGYLEFEYEIADFSPPHSSECVDTDEDGLYDYLAVDVSLSVIVPGTYEIVAYLYTPSGYDVDRSTATAYLDAGAATVEVTFSGFLLRNRYESGSFNLNLYLYDASGRYLASGGHTTAYCDYLDFEDWPAEFGSPHEGYASDDDYDSLYDRYAANLTVVVYSAGTFYIGATLQDEGHDRISSGDLWATLEEGTHVVQVSFPGWVVYANGYCAEYLITALLFDSRMNYISLTSFETGAYDHEAFDPTRPAIESRSAVSPPMVDGAIAAYEWSDAVLVYFEGIMEMECVKATLMVMNDADTLYVCVDAYGDVSRNRGDEAFLAFDTGNDGVRTSGHEDTFKMRGDSLKDRWHDTYSEYWLTGWEHCSPFDDDGLIGAVGFGTSLGHPEEHRIYEFAIPLSLLGVSPGGTIGFSVVYVYDQWNMHYTSWPSPHPIGDIGTLYGELLLAEPATISSPSTIASAAGTEGANGWYSSGVDVTLTATGGDGGVDYTEYRLDGGSWTTYAEPISMQTEGAHMLEFRSVDNAGNVEPTRSLTVKIDRVAPITTSAVSGSHVWLNATDATSGLGRTMYRIDGGAWQNYSGVLNITGEGTHTVEFYSVDFAGNAELTQSLEVETVEGGCPLADTSFYWVLLIIALIAIASIGAILGMRRKAKESDAKSAIKDIGTAYSQMMEEGPPKRK